MISLSPTVPRAGNDRIASPIADPWLLLERDVELAGLAALFREAPRPLQSSRDRPASARRRSSRDSRSGRLIAAADWPLSRGRCSAPNGEKDRSPSCSAVGWDAGDVVLDVEIARKERDSAQHCALEEEKKTGKRQRGAASSLLEDSGQPG
jgi:hypothetical protein